MLFAHVEQTTKDASWCNFSWSWMNLRVLFVVNSFWWILYPMFHKLNLPSFKKKNNEIWVQEERLLKLLPWLSKRRNQQPSLFDTNLFSLLVPIPIIINHYIVPIVIGIITQGIHVGSYMVIHQDSPSIPRTIISSPMATINLQQIMSKKPHQHMFSPLWMDWLNYNYKKNLSIIQGNGESQSAAPKANNVNLS